MLWIWILASFVAHFASLTRGTYNTDCSANERLRCRVEEELCASNPQSDEYPSAPYDLRVSPYLVANPIRKPDSYQLTVNISWLPTHERNINLTMGYEITILDKDTDRQKCFTFQLDQPVWEERDRHESTRFRFSTVDMFDYGHNYYVEVQSLPKPLNRTAAATRNNFISQEVLMPGHPEPESQPEMDIDYCSPSSSSKGAHPHASRWVAAFRNVHIQPKMRWIYVDFVAAPAHYCFEEYDLRLIDDRHHLVQQARIQGEELTYEMHDGILVAFGNYTFHNVTVGWYDVGVIPVAYSQLDGRCLCPMPNRVCTCSLSIWPEVEMPAPPSIVTLANPCDYLPPVKLPFDCPQANGADNKTGLEGAVLVGNERGGASGVATLVCICIGLAAVTLVGSIVLIMFYRKYKRKGGGRLYLLPVNNDDTETTAARTISTEMSTIFRPVKLTIVYSHDCNEYDRVVRDLVHFLNTQCICDVSVDYLCGTEIAANKFDWAYKSVSEADRVLLLNSYGAYMRYQAKLVNAESQSIVERSEAGQFDDLFMLQLDLLAQECQMSTNNPVKKFVSVTFPFTPDQCVLPHANPSVRYQLPKHFLSLMVNLHNLPFFNEWEDDGNEAAIPPHLRRVNKDQYNECAEGENFRESIEKMSALVREQPDWFERLHVRRVLTAHNPLKFGSESNSRSIENNLLLPSQSGIGPNAETVSGNGDSSAPLLNCNSGESGMERNDQCDQANNVRTGNYAESVDSGVAVSSTKPTDQNSSSPSKHGQNIQLNGVGAAAHQRLIA